MRTMTLRRWDPLAEFDALFRSVDAAAPLATPAEVLKDGEDAVVRVAVPGLDPENDLNVELERGSLVIKGERREQRAEDSETRHVGEIRYGQFRRTFGLPGHVSEADLSASYDAGIVTVRVAGAYKGSEATRIPVSAGAPVLTN